MKFQKSDFIIPFITIAVAAGGSFCTTSGMEWYRNVLQKPALTPPTWAFPLAWNIIFILTTIAVIKLWRHQKKFSKKEFLWINLCLALNAILNVLWSGLFFVMHDTRAAFVEMFFLEATILISMALLWKKLRTSAILLLPYALWVGFATYLTLQILQQNE